ncbi:hypothetical protein ACMZOO_13170 [Catenovulum sp. SX2]|uniref:hypothetical protein n=1 Tax=Catenovulum sp. SX2 TaxID=3398614 RepID=UPI003F84E6F3
MAINRRDLIISALSAAAGSGATYTQNKQLNPFGNNSDALTILSSNGGAHNVKFDANNSVGDLTNKTDETKGAALIGNRGVSLSDVLLKNTIEFQTFSSLSTAISSDGRKLSQADLQTLKSNDVRFRTIVHNTTSKVGSAKYKLLTTAEKDQSLYAGLEGVACSEIDNSGLWACLVLDEKTLFSQLGAIGNGIVDDTIAINAGFILNKCTSENNKTYLFNSSVNFARSFAGGDSVKFLKGADNAYLILHPDRKVYADFEVDAGGFSTGVDVRHNGNQFDGIKYSFLANIRVRNYTVRGFNINQAAFGATLIHCRALSNASDGSQDASTMFYFSIEENNGIGTPNGETNASFSLLSPNGYCRKNAANDTTFIQADYCRGVSITGAEVAAARIIKGTQFDGSMQGAFEFVNTHSALYNSNLKIGEGSNIQTFRKGIESWTGDTNIPASTSVGRHIFRVDGAGSIKVEGTSFFNQMGTDEDSGSIGLIGLVACASGFTGKAKVASIHKYNSSNGGFAQLIQVANESGAISKKTLIGETAEQVVFTRDVLSSDGMVNLYPSGKTSIADKYVRDHTEIREFIIELEGDTLTTDVAVRIETFDETGAMDSSLKVVHTIPSGSASGFKIITNNPNRSIAEDGKYKISIAPSSSSMGTNTRISVIVRENY